MKGYYWLLIWYVVISIGQAQLIMDVDTIGYELSEYSFIGFILMLGTPTVIYLFIRNKKQKKLAHENKKGVHSI